jgi:transcriptional antiterminator NusG
MDDNQLQDQNTEETSTPEPVEDVQAAEVVEAAPIEEAPVAETVAPAEDTTSSDTTEPVSDTPSNARWYVVHTYSGHENRVAQTLKQRVEAEHLENKIFDVLVPTQDKIEIKGGKKATIKEKIFPGYILVKMILDDESWLAVRTTQGVTSFIGMGSKPTPTYKTVYNEGDTVKITEGPFTEFIGKVDNVDKDRGKVRVLVSIFGRETPVELDFLQVQKL